MSVPLGFVLGCTDDEFYSHCEQLVKKYGGRKSGTEYKITTDEFGVQDSMWINCFHYFSDSNTETNIVDKITFSFCNIGYMETSDIDKIISALDTELEGWEQVDFNATSDMPYTKYNSYHKFWVKNNISVHLETSIINTIVSFMNTPKYGTKWTKEDIEESIKISEEIASKKQQHTPRKVENSPWDGSVYQVKNYLKKTLKDPDSYEGIEWSEVIKNNNGTYTVRHKFRARNSFGGMVVENYVFVLNETGEVISATQL